jgi:hypothetical protein
MENLWATGVVTEGSRFYTTVLSRPGAPSRLEEDAENSVGAMFQSIRRREAAKRTSVSPGIHDFQAPTPDVTSQLGK